jgi:hypothetical protein
MRLTQAQERLLLRKHLTGDFGVVKSFDSIRILLGAGYLQEDGCNLVVTKKGREYCDTYHHEIMLTQPASRHMVREECMCWYGGFDLPSGINAWTGHTQGDRAA